MASITKLKTAQSIQFFDHSVALNLLQAFHRHLDLTLLLELFCTQASAVIQTVGIHYSKPDDDIDLVLNRQGRHTASYNLSYQEEDLGQLVFSFDTRVTEETLATAEDLVALVMSPIRNALLYRRACAAPPDLTDAIAMPRPGRDDALVLVKVDDIDDIRERFGDEWARTLVQATQNQIEEGLREADGVFQIGDEQLAVLLPRTSQLAAEQVAEKLRMLIAGLHLRDADVNTQLTACMGVAGTGNAESAEEVLDRARAALVEAQLEGANTIRVC